MGTLKASKKNGPRVGLVRWSTVLVALGIARFLVFLASPDCARAERLPVKTYSTADGLARDVLAVSGYYANS
jgi:hypothetical protein